MVYGYGTQSHIKSTEFKQTQRDRAEFTKRYEAGEIRFPATQVPLMCTCPQRPYPHELQVHATLASDWAAWSNGRPKNSWPWSLRNLADPDGPR